MTLRSTLAGAGTGLLRGVLDLVYPARCLVCQTFLGAERRPFCSDCESALFTDALPACPRCAGTVGPFAVHAGCCASCRNETLHFDQAVRVGPYDGLRRDVVLRLKNAASEGLAECIGEHWGRQAGDALRATGVEVVVAVPLHWWRRWRRGYNQAAALAHGLAVALRLPAQPWALRRVRDTPMQSSLSAEGRRENVQGAFRMRRGRLDGRCVLLVDDVLTTGATCSEAARALKEGGAARVVVAALARA